MSWDSQMDVDNKSQRSLFVRGRSSSRDFDGEDSSPISRTSSFSSNTPTPSPGFSPKFSFLSSSPSSSSPRHFSLANSPPPLVDEVIAGLMCPKSPSSRRSMSALPKAEKRVSDIQREAEVKMMEASTAEGAARIVANRGGNNQGLRAVADSLKKETAELERRRKIREIRIQRLQREIPPGDLPPVSPRNAPEPARQRANAVADPQNQAPLNISNEDKDL